MPPNNDCRDMDSSGRGKGKESQDEFFYSYESEVNYEGELWVGVSLDG